MADPSGYSFFISPISPLQEQRLLLRGAHVTLVSTMDHLAVANLLEGRTQKAVKVCYFVFFTGAWFAQYTDHLMKPFPLVQILH